MPTINNINIGTINSGNKDLTINVPPGSDISKLIHTFMTDSAEDIPSSSAATNESQSQPSSVSPESNSGSSSPAPDVKPEIPLFKYIHYKITEENEQLKVHKMVCNIVRLPKMQQVCDALVELMRQEQILSTIDQTAMLTELRRLGLPSDLKGFSDKNFYSFYRTK